MFFYIDEAGNSGNNLFDRDQPILSYGVLSSERNLDALAVAQHKEMLRTLKVNALHANELRTGGLETIAAEVLALKKQFRLKFDYYFIDKRSFAIVTFFNAVFDQGLNEAVPWAWYWTPLKFPLVAALSEVMDEPLLRRSWDLCITPSETLPRREQEIVALLGEVQERIANADMDPRLREVLTDGLRFGKKHPLQIDFGTYSRKALSPNVIGIQFVCHAIARRLKESGRGALGIYVDRQTEFNNAQQESFGLQGLIARGFRKGSRKERDYYLAHPSLEGARADAEALISHFPEEKLVIASSDSSIGIQIADVFLWTINRVFKNEDVPPGMSRLAREVMKKALIDGISVAAMMRRWEAFEKRLPEDADVPSHLRSKSEDLRNAHRAKVDGMDL